jgi:hypothetical protein
VFSPVACRLYLLTARLVLPPIISKDLEMPYNLLR